jgi:hypothetical protein
MIDFLRQPPDNSATGHLHNYVLARATMAILALAMLPILGDEARLIKLRNEIVEVVAGLKDHIAATPAIAAAWATLGHEGLPAKSDAAPASTAGARVDFHLVDEHGVIIPRTIKKARRDTSPEMV